MTPERVMGLRHALQRVVCYESLYQNCGCGVCLQCKTYLEAREVLTKDWSTIDELIAAAEEAHNG